MDVKNIKDFIGGWIIGDFDKSVLKTKDFEVGYKVHPKDDNWPEHFHKVATEYNVVISGKCIIMGKELSEGDVFIIHPLEVSKPIFLEETTLLTIKVPSVPGDKYIVNKEDNQ